MYLKRVKNLTIEDLEAMRHPDYLGDRADFLISLVYKVTNGQSSLRRRSES